jgi:hypothetical protein
MGQLIGQADQIGSRGALVNLVKSPWNSGQEAAEISFAMERPAGLDLARNIWKRVIA